VTAEALEISSPIALIAAGGVMPFAVADSLAARGIDPVLFALKGVCDPVAVKRFRHHWIAVGQYGRAVKLFRAENCRDLLFIGALVRPALSELRLDWGSLRVAGRVVAAYRGGDDHLLSGMGRILEQDGFRVVGIKDAAPDLLMPEGCLTRASPSENAAADIARGRDVLGALSQFEKAMQEMAKNGKGASGPGMPMPWGEPQSEPQGEGEQEGDDGLSSREHVEIPDAESSRGPQEFRKGLLDAMKQKAPDRYRERVKQYYEELVK